MKTLAVTDNPGVAADGIERVLDRVFWRIVPLFFVVFLLDFLDRLNVGYAALRMNAALGFTPSVFGTGAGIFFLGYILCNVPASIVGAHFGARRAVAAMMIAWGLVSAGTAFIWNAPSFFAMRFLLGMVQAGLYPMMLLYLTIWLPLNRRGRAIAFVTTAPTVFGVIGGPLAGALLELQPHLGLVSWQWMFIIQGLPTVILGLAVHRWLPDKPVDAAWLDASERQMLTSATAPPQQDAPDRVLTTRSDVVRDWRVWALATTYMLIGAGFITTAIWLPLIVRHLAELQPVQIGTVTAIPYILATVTTLWAGWHCDRTGLRHRYVIGGGLVGASGLMASAFLANDPAFSFVALVIAFMGITTTQGPFFAFATALIRGRATSVAIAMISIGGSMGGFLGSTLLGRLREQFGDFVLGLYAMGTGVLIGALLMAFVARFCLKPAQPVAA